MSHSAIFEGTIRHRRFAPTQNDFTYRIFMMLLDLDELPQLFDRSWLWSSRGWALARYSPEDHHGAPGKSQADAIRDLVLEKLGRRPAGPVRILTNLRYYGFIFNPVSFYYCYAEDGTTLEAIVSEIHNTPWLERHCYVHDFADAPANSEFGVFALKKAFHVSPFIPMEIDYKWTFNAPLETLFVHMENHRSDGKMFDATMNLQRREITGRSLAKVLLSHPPMTMKVVALIYWQALRLWWKRTPFYDHPKPGP